MNPTKAAFITGASSGIGHALALELAARGYDLALAARRRETLVQLKDEIARRYPERRVELFALDVTRYGDVPAAVEAAAKTLGGISLVIANAGVGSGRRVGDGGFEQDRQTIETNVLGAMATLDAAVALCKRQGYGQLVAISSVAAFRGLPTSAAYSASKAAIAVYADAVRAELHGTPIKVTTLYPGYIDTPINQMIKNRPFLVSVDKGARIIADLIERGVQEATVPVFPWNLISRLVRVLPTATIARMAG
ncbi:MAG: SDR family oxidoreductase [Nevskiales bacterium]